MIFPFATTAPSTQSSPTTSGVGGFFGIHIWKPLAFAPNGANITANNAIKCVVFTLPFATTVTGLAINITTAVAGTVVDIGLYNAVTGAGILNSNGSGFGGAGLSGATAGVKSATFTKVTIPAGQYLLAWTGNSSGAITSLAYAIAGSANTTVMDTLANAVNGEYFTSSDSATAGILPSSLTIAHLTKGTGGFDPPMSWFGA
jgi:hypothetical protein